MLQNQNQFARTMSGLTRNVNAITGGNTFCYVIASDLGNAFLLTVTAKGENPLHDITVDMVDVDLQRATKQPWTWDTIRSFRKSYPVIAGLASSSGRTSLILDQIPMATGDSRNLAFAFFSTSGSWTEQLNLRRVNGQWLQATKITQDFNGKSNKRKTLYEYVPPNYPMVNGKMDW